MQNPPTVRIGGQVSKSLYQYSMQSPDREAAVRRVAQAAEGAGRTCPGLEDLTSDLEITSPQVNVEIDRDKAAALGVTANQIENAFYDAYGPRWVSTIYAPVNEYKVLLELAPEFQADPSALSLLYFKATPGQGGGANNNGANVPTVRVGVAVGLGASGGVQVGASPGIVVPLDTLARTTQVVGPQSVNHHGQLAAVTHLVRPGARRVARRRADPGRRGGRPHASRHGQRPVPGRGKSIPELARQPRRAAGDRGDGRLHRARHPLRELHSPADDSLGAAVGGVRRAGHADRLPHGSEHLRVRRHDHADRHRREERDHADRLRARGRAQRARRRRRRSTRAA